MRELFGTAVNFALIEGEESRLRAVAEIAIILSEPRYEADGAGGLIRRRVLTQERYATTAKNLRSQIAELQDYADEMEALERRASLDKPEESPKRGAA